MMTRPNIIVARNTWRLHFDGDFHAYLIMFFKNYEPQNSWDIEMFLF
jgi:hypothetical protein